MFKNNSITVLCSVIIDAVFPFIFIGALWSEVLEYVMIGIGVAALIGLGVGFYLKGSAPQWPWLKDCLLDLGFPYALTLAVVITFYATGANDLAPLLWIPAAIALLTLISYAVKGRVKKD